MFDNFLANISEIFVEVLCWVSVIILLHILIYEMIICYSISYYYKDYMEELWEKRMPSNLKGGM